MTDGQEVPKRPTLKESEILKRAGLTFKEAQELVDEWRQANDE